ncbi:MAG: hypothetical protein P8181_06905 [bacterium]
MKRWIKIIAVIPVMLMLNQCIVMVYTSGCVEGFVMDAIDGYPLAGVCVRVYSPCSGCPHSHRSAPVVEVFTDCHGRFAFEIPWKEDYYNLTVSKFDYAAAHITLHCAPEYYLEIALEPLMEPPY